MIQKSDYQGYSWNGGTITPNNYLAVCCKDVKNMYNIDYAVWIGNIKPDGNIDIDESSLRWYWLLSLY